MIIKGEEALQKIANQFFPHLLPQYSLLCALDAIEAKIKKDKETE